MGGKRTKKRTETEHVDSTQPNTQPDTQPNTQPGETTMPQTAEVIPITSGYQLYATSDSGKETPLTALDFESDEWVGSIYSDPNRLPLSVKDECFHAHDGKGHPVGVIDNRIFTYLTHTQHIFVCGGKPYVYEGGVYKLDQNGTIIKTLIKACCLEQFIKSTTTDRIYKLFLQAYELVKFPEDMNDHPARYINFQNGMYDSVRKKVYSHAPKILSVNQLPWNYDPNADHGPGSEIENFLKQAIPDEDDREMLLEYIGLCCTKDVKQQKMLVICGEGGTGKSTIINLIQDIVGKRNCSNVAMSKLSQNFQAIRMMGKLLNSCADLEIDALDDVTMIKKLIGEDAISDSYKGQDIISFDNYAKLLFSTNELPLVRNEKTGGFYRRLLVLTMNEQPKHRDPRLYDRLKNEIPYLIHLAMEALYRMYERGYIIESEQSKAKIKQLRCDSDSIEAFLTERCMRGHYDDRIDRITLHEKYTKYCEEEERQSHKKNAFFKALRNKGFGEVKSNGTWYFHGIKLKDDSKDLMPIPSGTLEGIPFEAL